MTEVPAVSLVNIDLLKVDGENPNRMTDRQLKALNESVNRFGFIIPIITNRDYLIADGEQRYTVAKARGMKEVPVVRLDVTDVDRRLLRGQHQEDLDAKEYLRIVEAGESESLKSLIMLSEGELQRHLDLLRDPKPEDVLPEIIESSNIQLGDIYQLGSHRLMCGDATEEVDVSVLMNGDKADMVFTDPPYVAFGSTEGFASDIVDDKMIAPFLRGFMQNIRLYTKLGGHVYIFMDWKTYPSFHNINKTSVGLSPKNLIVWHKPNARLGGMYSNSHELIFFLSNRETKKRLTQQQTREKTVYSETNVWVYSIDTNTERLIFSQKPLDLPLRAIKNSTENPDIVLDLFGGSGSTLIACEQTGRRCRMMEIDPRYCQVIITRWENYTGHKAVQLNVEK
jgi:DNA modification methylase